MDKSKRYQIFVSSTFADLEVERVKVMQTIVNFDCFPAGMEMFPAMDEEIFQYIKRVIDDSDYYLLIIGGRYGSVDENGVSWTEKEYDYAVSRGIPVIAFDHRDLTKLPISKTDPDDKKRKKLFAFKQKVANGRLIRKWSNADDLVLAVATSLKRVLELQPRIGWVRADSLVNDDSQKEIERLVRDISKYQNEIKRLESSVEALESALKKNGDDNHSIESSYQTIKEEIEILKERNKIFEEQNRILSEQNNNLEEQNNKLKEQINQLEEKVKSLNYKLEKYKNPKDKIEQKSLPQIEIIAIPGTEVSFKMVFIEGGTFMMGANKGDTEANWDEKPAHEVTLSDYWIGETQVTQALWVAVMGENPSKFKGDTNLPVEHVSFEDCREFIKRLNKLTGREFRLPTEAQWEFAARGGNQGKDNHHQFAGSNRIGDVSWYHKNSERKTHPVGGLDPNELGIYDMSGNVWEWCNDWFRNYSRSTDIDPCGPKRGFHRVCRGGSCVDTAKNCRISLRTTIYPKEKTDYFGLRLAL